MPDGLELHQRGDLVRALGGGAERVGVRARDAPASRSRPPARSTSAMRSAGTPGDVDRVHVHMAGEPRHELGHAAGQHVDHAAGNVGRRQHLRQGDGRQRGGLARDRRRPCCPRRSRAPGARPDPAATGPAAPPRPTTPVGSGIVKLKYGPGDGVRGRRAPGAILSPQPAYQTHRSIAASTPAVGIGSRRRRPARRGTARGGPPSARPPGRGSGRGCTRSCPAQPGCAARAATTASRRSLREACAA